MKIESIKEICTGCSACTNICPVKAIEMKYNEEGFLYPIIDTKKCIKCHKCETVCPALSKKVEKDLNFQPVAYAAVTKDKEVWLKSTSGGAFTEICKAFGDDETYIYGAAWSDLKVIHKWVKGIKNIGTFRKSKYIQSDINNSFITAKAFLDEGKKVIFSGTPCQIAGFKNYLSHDYDNLLLIDFICHGVGSPIVFSYYILCLEKKIKQKVDSYEFRYKKSFFRNLTLYNAIIKMKNGKQKIYSKDLYNYFYLNQLCTRKSCSSNCNFKPANRISDITISDLKRKDLLPIIDKKNWNYSTIIFNTKKSLELESKLKQNMSMYEIEIGFIEKYNSLYSQKGIKNSLREEFFKDYKEKKGFDFLGNKYNYKKGKNKFSYYIPYIIKYYLKKVFK